MKRILLTGANGQIGWELRNALGLIGQVIPLGQQELDITKPDAIRRVMRTFTPEIIVNAAAYTKVDDAEQNPEMAMTINGFAPGVIAEEAKRMRVFLVHYSTDYVFDGKKPLPYIEADPPNPINEYGRSKLAGEKAIVASGCDFLILRTSWIYGTRRENFLKIVMRAIEKTHQMEVVDDQIGVPNWSRFVAEITSKLVDSISNNLNPVREIYHLSASGSTSWFGFAKEIFQISSRNKTNLFPKAISSERYPRIAIRPDKSILNSNKLSRDFNIPIPTWEFCLNRCLDSYLASIDQVP